MREPGVTMRSDDDQIDGFVFRVFHNFVRRDNRVPARLGRRDGYPPSWVRRFAADAFFIFHRLSLIGVRKPSTMTMLPAVEL